MSTDYFKENKPVWVDGNTHAILKQIQKISKPFKSMNVLIKESIHAYLRENDLEGL